MRRFMSTLLCLCMAITLLPTCALADETNGRLGIYWVNDSEGRNYDVRGLKPDGTAISTTYNNYGYRTVLRHAGTEREVDFIAAGSPVMVAALPGLSVKVDYAFVSAGRYLQITYTLLNSGNAAITGLDIGARADIQIGGDDSASIYRTDTGFRMVNTKTNPTTTDPGYNKQFNLVCRGGMGVVDVSTMWFGRYSDAGISYKTHTFDNTGDSVLELTGVDSALAFSWQGMTVPAQTDSNGVITPGSVVRSLLFSVSEQGTPPAIPAGGRPQLYLQAAGQKMIIVNAKVRDMAGLTDTLYYTINNGAEQAIGSVVADGGEKTLAGYIDLTSAAPNDYALQMWIMNSRGIMSEVVEKNIRINANNSIDEVTSDGVIIKHLAEPTPEDGVVRPLGAPASPAWDASGGVVSATWNAVAGATSYYVQLYDASGNERGAALEAIGTSLDCTAALSQHGSGSYTFKVIAASATASSLPSDPSGPYAFTVQGAPGGSDGNGGNGGTGGSVSGGAYFSMSGGGYMGSQYAGAWNGGVLTVQTDCSKLVSVTVDGVQLTKDKDYTVTCGSTIITFTPPYLASFKDGAHSIRVQFADGRYDGAFITPLGMALAAAPDVPATGSAPVWAHATALIGLFAAAYTIRRRRA